MKEATKEWLGIKPADFVIYAGFLLLVPVYYSTNRAIDIICLLLGFSLCMTSCLLGMKPHPELGKATNTIKLVAYPVCTLFYLYIAYLSFSVWK